MHRCFRCGDFRLIPADGMSCVSGMFSHCRVPNMSTGEGVLVLIQPMLDCPACLSHVCCRAIGAGNLVDNACP